MISISLNSRRYAKGPWQLVCLATVVASVPAQQPTAGEKTRSGDHMLTVNAPAATYNSRPNHLLKTSTARAVLVAIDLKERTLRVVPVGDNQKFRVAELGTDPLKWSQLDELQMEFLAPPGFEQIKVSKKASRALGKERLTLEELTLGSEVRAEFYPVRVPETIEVAVREIRVEKLAPRDEQIR